MGPGDRDQGRAVARGPWRTGEQFELFTRFNGDCLLLDD